MSTPVSGSNVIDMLFKMLNVSFEPGSGQLTLVVPCVSSGAFLNDHLVPQGVAVVIVVEVHFLPQQLPCWKQ